MKRYYLLLPVFTSVLALSCAKKKDLGPSECYVCEVELKTEFEMIQTDPGSLQQIPSSSLFEVEAHCDMTPSGINRFIKENSFEEKERYEEGSTIVNKITTKTYTCEKGTIEDYYHLNGK